MSEKTTCKEAVLLGLYDCLLFLIRLTPKLMIPYVAQGVCFFGRRFVRRDVGILRDNLEQVLDIPKGCFAAEEFEKRTFFNHVCSALETLKSCCNPDKLQIEGKEKLSELIEKGRKEGSGCLFITAHLGSWEVIGWVLSKLSNSKCHVLARQPNCKALRRFFEKFRDRLGMEVLFADRPLILRDMVKALKSGGFLAVAMDQRPVGGRRASVEFFGRETDFVCGPAIAAGMAGCPVVAVFCVRKGPMQYELISREVVPTGHDISDTNELTQIMATEIERVVNLYPEQWAWHYDRWQIEESIAPVVPEPAS